MCIGDYPKHALVTPSVWVCCVLWATIVLTNGNDVF